MASLVSTGFLWSGGSNVAFGKGKTRSPFDERRLLEQNKKIQEANNAPVNFPNFVREGNFLFSITIYILQYHF